MAEDRKTLGEVLHEAREAGNDGRHRPMILAPWADRAPTLKALDEATAAVVEAEVRSRVASDLRSRALHEVPGVIREAWRAAAEVAMKGGTS